MESLRDIFNSYKEEIVDAKGLTCIIDNVECYGLAGKVKKIWFQDKFIYKGVDRGIFVDKNHDLSYYVNGSDWVDSFDYNQSPGTYGYEWGGYDDRKELKITSKIVGSGLKNTNAIIEENLKPHAENWRTIWNLIRGFREFYSDNWFLPSRDELNLIYEARSNLNNLSLYTNPYYWSSSEADWNIVWTMDFRRNEEHVTNKTNRMCRTRLCVVH